MSSRRQEQQDPSALTAQTGTPARAGAAWTLAFAFCATLFATCYNPKIVSGQLECAKAPAKQCPDGFKCEGTVCVTTGTTGSGGAGGHAGAGGTGAATGSGGGVGTGGNTPPRQVGQTCDQSTGCDTNLICMSDCSDTEARCYQLCQGAADCPTSTCTRTVPGTSQLVCDVPFMTCDPETPSGCASASQSCFLLSSAPTASGDNSTVCDCPGSKGPGVACSDSRECFAKEVCPPADSGLPGAGYCRVLCTPNLVPPDPVCGLDACHAFGTTWGYCY
jgi:hypothetical protein